MSDRVAQWQAEQSMRVAVAQRRDAISEIGEAVMRLDVPEGGWPEEIAALIERCKAANLAIRTANTILDRRTNRG